MKKLYILTIISFILMSFVIEVDVFAKSYGSADRSPQIEFLVGKGHNDTTDDGINKNPNPFPDKDKDKSDGQMHEKDECNGLMGEEFTKIINNIFKTIQYLGPVLVAIFTTSDFLKAVLSGDPADMKKASGKFSKRLVAAILLFFIPLICKLLFGLVGITMPENCIG